MILLKYAIESVIDDEPDWVKAARRRRAYRMEQEVQEVASKVWHAIRADGASAHVEYQNRLQTTPRVEWHVDQY